MKKRILLSIMTIAMTATIITGATTTYFSDKETSVGNTFTAGKLDLQIDGKDENVIKFNATNMKPGSQPVARYTLKNAGTINGYLDISNIVVTDFENGLTDPEVEAGDITSEEGELSSIINIRLYFDNDKDGYYSTGDTMIYNGKMGDMPESFDCNKLIAAGEEIRLNAIVDWWSTNNDNLAQSDSTTLDLEFTLNQIA